MPTCLTCPEQRPDEFYVKKGNKPFDHCKTCYNNARKQDRKTKRTARQQSVTQACGTCSYRGPTAEFLNDSGTKLLTKCPRCRNTETSRFSAQAIDTLSEADAAALNAELDALDEVEGPLDRVELMLYPDTPYVAMTRTQREHCYRVCKRLLTIPD